MTPKHQSSHAGSLDVPPGRLQVLPVGERKGVCVEGNPESCLLECGR